MLLPARVMHVSDIPRTNARAVHYAACIRCISVRKIKVKEHPPPWTVTNAQKVILLTLTGNHLLPSDSLTSPSVLLVTLTLVTPPESASDGRPLALKDRDPITIADEALASSILSCRRCVVPGVCVGPTS